MNNFLAKLKPDTKVNVGVSVSPNVGLEMIIVDPVQQKVMKYAHRPIGYNQSTREIEDYGEFKMALNELFSELKIQPQNSNVVLNLPNVLFNHTYLQTTLDDESVTGALISKAEETYLFKKNTPSVSWTEVRANNTTEKRYILYSAIQESVVDKMKQIFSDLGATLVAIENTYSSLIKTLEYTGIADDFAKNPGSWNILLISPNSYSVFSLVEYNVIEYYEDPLAIKSFSNDEVCVAIAQAASSVLDRFPSDKLLIISESQDVSAEILSIQLKHPGQVMYLESNQYSKTPIMDIDLTVLPKYATAVTPEVIGAGIYKFKDFNLKLNFINTNEFKSPDMISFMGMEFTKEQIMVYAIISAVIVFGLCFAIKFAIGSYSSTLEAQKNELANKEAANEASLQKLRQVKGTMDIYAAAKTIENGMSEKILYYTAIGSDIPQKVWLTSFYADSNQAYGIKGETLSVDDVYLFFRGIKSQVPDSNLVLSKLSVDDENGLIDIEKTPIANYSFELTNSNYTSMNTANVDGGSEAPDQTAGSDNQGISVPNLPLLP